MGEAAKKIGEKLESFSGQYLLTRLGWQQLLSDFEIKCTRSSHKNPAGKSKRTHGIDLLCSFFDPYATVGQAVVIECKNRQMTSITATSVGEWVSELINNIECAQSAAELQTSNVDTSVLSTGLLLIHANDGNYDEQAFNTILRGLSIQNRRNAINVFIASNREIYMWTSLFQEIDKVFMAGDFKFLYPSIDGSSKILSNYIPINSLFSRYMFAQYKTQKDYNENGITGKKEVISSVMISFDDVSLDSYRYMWSMFKSFQMEGTDLYIFYFYPRKTEDTRMLTVENFLSAIEQDGKITDSTKSKIQVKVLDNRSLSPVDTLKG